MIVVRGYGDFPSDSDAEYKRFRHWIEEDHVGGFIVAGRIRNGNVIPAQPFEMAEFINYTQGEAKVPLLVASDFERGASMRVAGTARFPYMMAFGAVRRSWGNAGTRPGDSTRSASARRNVGVCAPTPMSTTTPIIR